MDNIMGNIMTSDLPLQTAYATWVQDEFDNCWVIYDKDHNKLAIMPKPADEYVSMAAIELGREFERQAFEEGYRLAQGAMTTAYEQKMIVLRNEIEMLKQMNVSISTELQRMMIMEDELAEMDNG